MFYKKELKTNIESASALLTGIFLCINIISSSILLHISLPITIAITTIITICLLGIKIQLEDKFADKAQKIIFALISSYIITCTFINMYIWMANTETILVTIFLAFCVIVDTIFIIAATSKLIMQISNYEYILYSICLSALYFKMEIFTYFSNVLPILAQIGILNCVGFIFLIGLAASLINALNRLFITSAENGDNMMCAALSLLVNNDMRNKALKIAIEENIPVKSPFISLYLAKYANKENIELGIKSAIENSNYYLIKYYTDSNNITPEIFEKCLYNAIENNNHIAIRDIAKSSKITEETINHAIDYANQNGYENCVNTITAARQP